jgi:hypothetical protein
VLSEPRGTGAVATGGNGAIIAPATGGEAYFPRDSSFFASLKAQLRTMNTSMAEDKRAAFLHLCEEYNPEMVKHYFADCG